MGSSGGVSWVRVHDIHTSVVTYVSSRPILSTHQGAVCNPKDIVPCFLCSKRVYSFTTSTSSAHVHSSRGHALNPTTASFPPTYPTFFPPHHPRSMLRHHSLLTTRDQCCDIIPSSPPDINVAHSRQLPSSRTEKSRSQAPLIVNIDSQH